MFTDDRRGRVKTAPPQVFRTVPVKADGSGNVPAVCEGVKEIDPSREIG